jgi:hypothetical protein
MSFWDAVTGKNLRFNTMHQEATRRVCVSLNGFILTQMEGQPAMHAALIDARNTLFAYYLATSSKISAGLDRSLVNYKSAILSMDVGAFMALLSALNTGHVLSTCVGRCDGPRGRGWLLLLLDALASMYAHKRTFTDTWLKKLEWITESEDALAGRLYFQIYDEISPLLGLPESDYKECTLWAAFATDCLHAARLGYDDRDWNTAVEREFAVHCGRVARR